VAYRRWEVLWVLCCVGGRDWGEPNENLGSMKRSRL